MPSPPGGERRRELVVVGRGWSGCRIGAGDRRHYIQATSPTRHSVRRSSGTIERFGRLDILVNNAGWTPRVDRRSRCAHQRDPLQDDPEVNVYGTWWMCKAAMPHLKRPRVASSTSPPSPVCGRWVRHFVRHGQAALNALTEDLAKFHGRSGATPSPPASVATPWTSEWGDLHTSIAAISPAGRSTPERLCNGRDGVRDQHLHERDDSQGRRRHDPGALSTQRWIIAPQRGGAARWPPWSPGSVRLGPRSRHLRTHRLDLLGPQVERVLGDPCATVDRLELVAPLRKTKSPTLASKASLSRSASVMRPRSATRIHR